MGAHASTAMQDVGSCQHSPAGYGFTALQDEPAAT